MLMYFSMGKSRTMSSLCRTETAYKPGLGSLRSRGVAIITATAAAIEYENR